MSIITEKITPRIANTPHIASKPNNGLSGQNGNLHHVIITGTSKISSQPLLQNTVPAICQTRFYHSVFDDKYAQSPIIITATKAKVIHITIGVATFNFNSIKKGNDAAMRMKIIKPIARQGYAKFTVQPVHLTRLCTTRRGSFLQ